ncbi:hypothetical protein V4C56_17750 [Paraburkholderia azotifigens]|uniref:Uncharacterized protein n=1 Tax=Paraburkholderia azotifigens TaxID=2057004 RepID=A0ABU9R328_9BURK
MLRIRTDPCTQNRAQQETEKDHQAERNIWMIAARDKRERDRQDLVDQHHKDGDLYQCSGARCLSMRASCRLYSHGMFVSHQSDHVTWFRCSMPSIGLQDGIVLSRVRDAVNAASS